MKKIGIILMSLFILLLSCSGENNYAVELRLLPQVTNNAQIQVMELVTYVSTNPTQKQIQEVKDKYPGEYIYIGVLHNGNLILIKKSSTLETK